ncbi:hypothetical protein ACFY2R_27425, partial [Micromonospora olivasterospora]
MASQEQRAVETNWARYRGYVCRHRRSFLLLAALIPLDVGTQLVAPQVVRRFLDAAVAGRSQGELAGYAAVFVVLAAVRQALSAGTGWVSGRVAGGPPPPGRPPPPAPGLRPGPHFLQRPTPGARGAPMARAGTPL